MGATTDAAIDQGTLEGHQTFAIMAVKRRCASHAKTGKTNGASKQVFNRHFKDKLCENHHSHLGIFVQCSLAGLLVKGELCNVQGIDPQTQNAKPLRLQHVKLGGYRFHFIYLCI